MQSRLAIECSLIMILIYSVISCLSWFRMCVNHHQNELECLGVFYIGYSGVLGKNFGFVYLWTGLGIPLDRLRSTPIGLRYYKMV